jgi:isopropylmalate/homocitrate/citramalate synthase
MNRGKTYEEGLWAVSPYNFDASINGTELPQKVEVLDLTLREGRQVEGVSLGIEEVIEYARRASAAGISLVEMHHDEPEEIRQVKKLGLALKIQALVHPTSSLNPKTCVEEIDHLTGDGADIICLSIVGSDYNFGLVESMAGMKMTRDEYLDRSCEAVAYGKKRGAVINTIVTDLFRMDIEWLKTITRRLAEAGADIIRLDDICAPCRPAVYQHHTREVKKVIGKARLAIHTHNDFDLGLASQLASLEGGAEILEGSVNGMGERVGVPNIAALASVLHLFYGYDTGIKLDAMQELSEFVANVWNQPIPSHMAVVGRTAFSHCVEVHYVLPKDGQWAFNSWSPKVVGNRNPVPLCHYSGPTAIKRKAGDLGLGELTTEVARQVHARVRRELRLRRTALSDALFAQLVRECRGDGR